MCFFIVSPESFRWPNVGKYKVNVASFESLALPELQVRWFFHCLLFNSYHPIKFWPFWLGILLYSFRVRLWDLSHLHPFPDCLSGERRYWSIRHWWSWEDGVVQFIFLPCCFEGSGIQYPTFGLSPNSQIWTWYSRRYIFLILSHYDVLITCFVSSHTFSLSLISLFTDF